MAKLGMIIDLKRCYGCYACVMACKAENFTPPGVFWARLLKGETGEYPNTVRQALPVLCMQCEDPECITVCMKNALTQEGNLVKWDEDKCIGCRMCVAACPYGGISSFKGKIIKCDLCDGDPKCVKFCSTGAIQYLDETEELEKRRKKMAERFLDIKANP